jgi:hypothetical protein
MWRSGPLPAPVAGIAAGLWAALTGLTLTVVLTMVVWIFAAGESASDTAMRVGADIWLAAHGAPFRVGSGVWTLMPWAWAVFPGVTLWAAGRWLAHRAAIAFVKSAAVAAGSMAAVYALVALLAALFGTMSGAAAMPMRAVLHAAVLAFGISFVAVVWRADLARDALRRAWRMSRPAAAALAVLVLGACLVLIGAVVGGHGGLAATLEQLRPGFVGGAALFIGWLGYLPAALMWALSYAVGTGVLVGGVAVTPTAPMPDVVDILGLNLLPVTAHPALMLGLLIPVAAGVALNRVAGQAPSWRRWAQDRAIALAVLLIVLDLWWFLSTGRIGEGRLDLLGPPPTVIPVLLAAVLVGLGGDLLARHAWAWWRRRRTIDLTEEPAPADEDVCA